MKDSVLGYEWIEPEKIDQEKVEEVKRRYNLTGTVAKIIVKRGLWQDGNLKGFLNPSLRDLSNPFRLEGLNNCAERLSLAVIKGEKILIHGDFDADGVTSTALLYLVLKELGLEAIPYIPNRISEGHGVSSLSLKLAEEHGVSLMVTCDVGISANPAIDDYNSKGIDVLVTDHHSHKGKLPNAAGIFNPALDPESGFAALSGVGVAFYLLVALRTNLREKKFFMDSNEPDLRKYLDLVALGTVADVSSMAGENRILVRHGLEVLSKSPRTGLDALKRISGLGNGRALNYTDVAFRLAPRINAACRMGDAMSAFELLITCEFDRAMELARKLEGFNLERKKIESEILKSAKEMVRSTEDFTTKRSFCIAGRNWHRGILGLAANRLCDFFGKTFCVISIGEDICRGSIRSIEPVHVLDILEQCSEFLIEYGGHELAGGFSIRQENIKLFSEKFTTAIKKHLDSFGAFQKKLLIDCELKLDEINDALVDDLDVFQPHGPDNLELNFKAQKVSVLSAQRMGTGHTKFILKRSGDTIEAVAFGLSLPGEKTAQEIDIVFTPEYNYYGSRKSLRLLVKDVKI